MVCPGQVGEAGPGRQADFLLGRLCARVALRRFIRRFDGDIPIGPNREPVFPAGISGSITHTRGFVAAMCQEARNGTVGLDAECLMRPDQAMAVGTAIATPSELDCPGWGRTSAETRQTLVFSAKESAFKALFPWVQRMLGFDTARVAHVNLDARILSLSLAPLGDCRLPDMLDIRFRLDADRVVTCAVVQPLFVERPDLA